MLFEFPFPSAKFKLYNMCSFPIHNGKKVNNSNIEMTYVIPRYDGEVVLGWTYVSIVPVFCIFLVMWLF